MSRYTKTLPANEWDGWNTLDLLEKTYNLNNGDTLEFQIAVANLVGSSQPSEYTIEVLDENNEIVYTAKAPQLSASYEVPYEIGYYVTKCPTTAPDSYEFDWSPAVIEVESTETSYSGYTTPTIDSDLKYVVAATSQSQHQCILKDSVVITKDDCGTLTDISEEQNASSNNQSSYVIYPNPTNGVLNIQTVSGVSFNEVQVYNLLGELVMSSKSDSWLIEKSLNIEHLNDAVYMIKVNTNTGTTVDQFIKRN